MNKIVNTDKIRSQKKQIRNSKRQEQREGAWQRKNQVVLVAIFRVCRPCDDVEVEAIMERHANDLEIGNECRAAVEALQNFDALLSWLWLQTKQIVGSDIQTVSKDHGISLLWWVGPACFTKGSPRGIPCGHSKEGT